MFFLNATGIFPQAKDLIDKIGDFIFNGVPLKPVANKHCTSCGLCARECPVGAISLDNPKLTDNKKCISCMYCVAICPNKARSYSELLTSVASLAMKKVCVERKENKLYI